MNLEVFEHEYEIYDHENVSIKREYLSIMKILTQVY